MSDTYWDTLLANSVVTAMNSREKIAADYLKRKEAEQNVPQNSEKKSYDAEKIKELKKSVKHLREAVDDLKNQIDELKEKFETTQTVDEDVMHDEDKPIDICPNCGAKILHNAAFCHKCGTKIINTCRSCGKHLPADAAYCPYCGTEIR